jgi:hypothetical protein
MATIDGSETDTPWGEHIDATHITGDVWYVSKYPAWYWYLAGVLCLLAPPAGVFLGVFLLSASVHRASEELDIGAAE